MKELKSFVGGEWKSGDGHKAPAVLLNPATEEPVAECSSAGIDFGAVLTHARNVGSVALRAMSFGRRAEILRLMSRAIHTRRDELIELAMQNGGNTRSDAKFDIDGASGTLGAYADLGESLGDARYFIDGEAIALGRSSRMSGQHVMLPRLGAAVHVNAFNFPAWGIAEKAAVALLAGMAVVTKPATATAVVSHRMTEIFIESDALPEGTFQFIAGSAGDLIDKLGAQDVLAFTGGGSTGTMLRGRPNILSGSVHVNVEADSLNAAVLGPDAELSGDTWQLFVSDVARDITQKTGQKCTAIRRVFVPEDKLTEIREALVERLKSIRVGDPRSEGVTMGPVATASQLSEVRQGISKLSLGARLVLGGPEALEGHGAPAGKGFFIAPTLLECELGAPADAVHTHEVFGPVATLIPYRSAGEVVALVARGGGGLVSTVYTDDRVFAAEVVLGLAPWHGRLCLGGAKVAGAWLGPGTVLPQLLHGGPGRAGGGEELGGLRGMGLYLQRTALQGYGPLLEHILSGAKRIG